MSDVAELHGRTAVVTGASSGMGERISRLLGSAGASVFAVARTKEKLETVCHEVVRGGGQAYPVPLDVSLPASAVALEQEITRVSHSLDIVINCAAITIKREIVDLADEEWDAVIKTNAKSVFLMAKYLGPILFRSNASRGNSKFLTFGSVGSFLGIPLSGVYCASKGAVVQLTRTLAVEWARHLVNVNAICPGYIETPLSSSVLKIGQTYQKVIGRIPMRSMGNVDDIAELVMFLVSQKSNYITGATINIDGGLMSAAYTMDVEQGV
jgi:NAD(P)-dependent dehydrogenase (short-subunit alcohol dehydrogenase family)